MNTQLLSEYCRDLDLISNFPSYHNESPSLHVEVIEIPSHRWDLKYKSIDIEGLGKQREFFMLLNSFKAGKPFTWKLPIHSDPIGEAGGAPTVITNYPAGSEEIEVINGSLNQQDWLHAGDLIQFNNATKVYAVMETVSTDNAGKATVRLNAPLAKDIVSTTSVRTKDIEFTLIYKPESKKVTYSRIAGDLDAQSYELEFVELL